MIIAHVAGVPVEEAVLPLATVGGTALMFARAWILTRVRRRDRERPAVARPRTGAGG